MLPPHHRPVHRPRRLDPQRGSPEHAVGVGPGAAHRRAMPPHGAAHRRGMHPHAMPPLLRHAHHHEAGHGHQARSLPLGPSFPTAALDRWYADQKSWGGPPRDHPGAARHALDHHAATRPAREHHDVVPHVRVRHGGRRGGQLHRVEDRPGELPGRRRDLGHSRHHGEQPHPTSGWWPDPAPPAALPRSHAFLVDPGQRYSRDWARARRCACPSYSPSRIRLGNPLPTRAVRACRRVHRPL